jgi:hypothetical protein
VTEPIRIRNSEIAAFRRCRRKWYNAYVLSLTNEATPDQKFSRPPGTNATGTYVHALLEGHYRGDRVSLTYEILHNEITHAESPFEAEWIAALELAETMYLGYLGHAADEGWDQAEETVATELSLEWEIMPGVFVTGQVDRLVRDTQWDRLIVEDYKTVATLDNGPQFQVDTQLLTYVLLANKNGYACSDARHTMLRRVKRSARAEPPFYGRAEVTFNEDQLAAHEDALRATVSGILAVRERAAEGARGVCYPNPTKDCSWDCPFLGICAAHDDGSDIDGLRAELFAVREKEKP